MSFVSYAQNFEDVMLWRALKHVEHGFYIDVGANDPSIDSVTLAFYDRGWHGINVEPMRQYHSRLMIKRPADINLAVAVGDAPGEFILHDVADTGLSTMNPDIAAVHVTNGRAVTTRPVQIMRLADICREHVRTAIHFLKIDVEGFEAAALRGMDFTQWRPWILVIEATRPQSQVRSSEEWSGIVCGAGYTLVYFDGLNEYYVADEHPELVPAFDAPPNFFDGFTLCEGHFFSHPLAGMEHRIWQAAVRLEAAEKAVDAANAWGRATTERADQAERACANAIRMTDQAVQARDHALQTIAGIESDNQHLSTALSIQTERAQHAEQLLAQTHASLCATQASVSWRVTRPLRLLKKASLQPGQALSRARSLMTRVHNDIRPLLVRAARRVLRQAHLRALARHILPHLPGINARLQPLFLRLNPAPQPMTGERSSYTPPDHSPGQQSDAVKLLVERLRRQVEHTQDLHIDSPHSPLVGSATSVVVNPSNAHRS